MVNLFTPDDFREWEFANTKLKAYIQCLEKVYGDMKLGGYHNHPILWSVDEKPDSTHSARLIGVERLIKTPGPS